MNVKTGQMPQTTLDGFLGGQVRALQPAKGYRSGADAVLLAAAVAVRDGEKCLELGCGVGVASLCLAKRLELEGIGFSITGVDIQPDLIRLARENADMNGFSDRLDFTVQDIAESFSAWEGFSPAAYHHVFANPPYFEAGESFGPPGESKARARVFADTDLQSWLKRAASCLGAGGGLTVVFRADALDRLLAALPPQFGSPVILPVSAAADAPAGRVIVRARRDAKGKPTLLPPLVMHDEEAYSEEVEGILRQGAGLQKRFGFR